jgi:hypothetical protein
VAVLGWLLAAGASLGGAVLFVPKALWGRWRERIVDRIDQAARRRVSRFDRKYREFVLASVRYIDLKGLATVGFYTPELDDVFVDVSLAYRAPHLVPEGVLGQPPPKEVTDRHQIMELVGQREPVVLAVIGAPGSGKTTLLRHTARVVCRDRKDRPRTVPMLLHLRDHVGTIMDRPGVTLAELVRGTLGRYAPDEPPGWLEHRLGDGDCVVLLDGLDEVARPEDRRKVADWVERQTRQYPRNDFVVTSRPHGYRTAGIGGAIVLQVRSLTDEQVSRFVRAWYQAVERHGDVPTGESAADDLLNRLNAAPALYDLTVNPLLLTMIANVHRYRGALPGSRVDLYREICEAILWRLQEAKNLPTTLSGDKKEAVLRAVAFAMMTAHVRDFPQDKVLTAIRPALRRMTRDLTAEGFLAEASSNGLLIERESEVYSFAHHTFQEYLAATHIRDKGLVHVLAEAVDDPWWRETTLLYTARSDADPIVKSCLESDTITALSLAFDCAIQCGELAPALRERLDNLLASTLDPERRRLVAGVLLTRHLAQLVRTTDHGRVCVNPIPASLYQLFLMDTRIRPPQWPAQEPNPDAPIAGVGATAATEFAIWANDLLGPTSYRLPTHEEITDPAVQRALAGKPHSVWLKTDGLWTPPRTAHPHVISWTTVAEHVRGDLQGGRRALARLILYRAVNTNHRIATDPDHSVDEAYKLTRQLVFAQRLAGEHLRHDFTVVHKLAGDLIYNLGSDHTLARASARDLGLALLRMEALDRTAAHRRALDRGLALDQLEVPRFVLGRAIDDLLGGEVSPEGWEDTLVDVFIGMFPVVRSAIQVAPEEISGLLGDVRQDPEFYPDETRSWCVEVSNRLIRTAELVVEEEKITPGRATAIRMGALCLAWETRKWSPFLDIAAGVTLLERRATGLAPVTETIMLATE